LLQILEIFSANFFGFTTFTEFHNRVEHQLVLVTLLFWLCCCFFGS